MVITMFAIIDKEKFEAYEMVRKSGLTNMWDVKAVIRLAKRFANIKLTKDEVLAIMKDYSHLKEAYIKPEEHLYCMAQVGENFCGNKVYKGEYCRKHYQMFC